MRKLSRVVGNKVDELKAKRLETELPAEDSEVRANILEIQNATLKNEASLGFRQNALEEQYPKLLEDLKSRFEAHMKRHPKLRWAKVSAKLESSPEKLRTLYQMESTGGEPDVVGFDKKTGEFIFFDCSKESPEGRRNLNYDQAVKMANSMGIAMLSEKEYKMLQKLGEFDGSTWSWIQTSDDIRKTGRALIGCRRGGYIVVPRARDSAGDHVDNRGFRGSLRV